MTDGGPPIAPAARVRTRATSLSSIGLGRNAKASASRATVSISGFAAEKTIGVVSAVDTGAVLLREGDVLRVRAATGLDREVELGFTLGEGFAGRIAADAKPLALTAATTDPTVKSPVLPKRGVKALFGVPLIHNGEVIGVAHMGSTTAREFSDEDKLLFRTMANRATAVRASHLMT